MTDRGLTIDVYSDIVCPWCYVGKRRLERALAQLDGVVRARSTWRPFQLNPTMSSDGMDRAAYLKSQVWEFGKLWADGRTTPRCRRRRTDSLCL